MRSEFEGLLIKISACNAYPSGNLVPSRFGTCLFSNFFPKLAMSFLDLSPWLSLGTLTFSKFICFPDHDNYFVCSINHTLSEWLYFMPEIKLFGVGKKSLGTFSSLFFIIYYLLIIYYEYIPCRIFLVFRSFITFPTTYALLHLKPDIFIYYDYLSTICICVLYYNDISALVGCWSSVPFRRVIFICV